MELNNFTKGVIKVTEEGLDNFSDINDVLGIVINVSDSFSNIQTLEHNEIKIVPNELFTVVSENIAEEHLELLNNLELYFKAKIKRENAVEHYKKALASASLELDKFNKQSYMLIPEIISKYKGERTKDYTKTMMEKIPMNYVSYTIPNESNSVRLHLTLELDESLVFHQINEEYSELEKINNNIFKPITNNSMEGLSLNVLYKYGFKADKIIRAIKKYVLVLNYKQEINCIEQTNPIYRGYKIDFIIDVPINAKFNNVAFKEAVRYLDLLLEMKRGELADLR